MVLRHVTLSNSDDWQVSDRLSPERFSTYHPTSHDREVADLLQSTERIKDNLRVCNWDALISEVVKNDWLAALFPQEE
jgi:hypothetical protein